MTAGGRTTWHARDAAEHDRELVVELGEEFAASGPYLLTVLKDLAQQQRNSGEVRTGFRSLARKAFCNPEDARRIVQHAGAIGALDDLSVDADDRRFTCRVSGWEADQARGTEAIRKAQQRAETPGDTSHAEGTCPAEPGQAPIETGRVPHTRHNQTIEEEPESSSSPDIARLCHLLADLILERDPKAKVAPASTRWLTAMRLLLADRGGDAAEVERVLRWSQSDSFWQGNILSPVKLREKFTQLAVKMRRPSDAVADQRAAPTRWAERAEQWSREDAEQERVA